MTMAYVTTSTPTRCFLQPTQAADDFSSFLRKENELESNSPRTLPTIRPALHDAERSKSAPALVPNANRGVAGMEAAAPDKSAAARPDGEGGNTEIDESDGESGVAPRRGVGNGAAATAVAMATAPGKDEENGIHEHRNFDDVTRPMGRQGGRPLSGGNGRAISGIFKKKGAPLLANRDDRYLAGLSEDEKQEAGDTRRSGGALLESATGGGGGDGGGSGGAGGGAELPAGAAGVKASGVDIEVSSSGAGGMPSSASTSSSIRVTDASAAGEKNDAGLVGLGFRRKRIDEV